MKLITASSGFLLNSRTGDNGNYSKYIMPGEIVLLTDDDANNIIDSNAGGLVGEVSEFPGISVCPAQLGHAIDVLPTIVKHYNIEKDIVATPEVAEIVKSFGVYVSAHYPIVFPYIDLFTEEVSVPNIEVIHENTMPWDSLSLGLTQDFPNHVSDMGGSKAMMWLSNAPSIHPAVTSDIANALSEIYDFVFICGNSDLELDLYKDLCYNDNVIDVVGRIGNWSSVIEFAGLCNTILSPMHWLVKLMHNLGAQCQVIGPSEIDGLDGIGTKCEYDMRCNECMYDYCPCISSIEASCEDGCINFDVGGV